MSNTIAAAINALKDTWMKGIAAHLAELHAKHGCPDISSGPTTDSRPLVARDYTAANDESDIEWFDQFYDDVERLQECADIRCIGSGLAVTSYNSTTAFTAYCEEARDLISEWLAHNAWDEYCRTH